MISFEQFTLANGLEVLVHQDKSSATAAFNLLYKVGSRDEQPDKTGFAHLFEHLMFGGSKNIASFDEPLQRVGGENNAFTNADITNYYITLPVANLETAFWLESDRMLELSFDPQVLEVQRKVVIEEFKQRYLNQPYGDAWLRLRPLAYQQHPYRWATIGKDISHIEQATMDDVKDFFYRFYRPNNAVLVVAGDVEVAHVKALAEKWFGEIPAGKKLKKSYPRESRQYKKRQEEVQAQVPLDAIYKAYHMPARLDKHYYTADLISDLLGRGKSSRLFQALVKENSLFNNINAYITGASDEGLLVIQGNVRKGVAIEEADAAIEKVLKDFMEKGVSEAELEKVKNKSISSIEFGKAEILNRAMALAAAAALGKPEIVNEEAEKIAAVSVKDVQKQACEILRPDNSSNLYYKALS